MKSPFDYGKLVVFAYSARTDAVDISRHAGDATETLLQLSRFEAIALQQALTQALMDSERSGMVENVVAFERMRRVA
jgi:hypothetical protein